ncbi:MAG: hypothetical protein HXY47_03755 [Nitrospirae bacterium]|nr:hypothetical protein [Nitrospirota bacterium]
MIQKEEKEFEKKDLDFVEAEFINIKQSTIRAVEGGHIELQQVGALSIDAEKIEVTQGASVLLRGNDVRLNQSLSAVTVGDDVSIDFSLSPVSVSRESTKVNRSAIGFLAAKDVTSENTSAFLVVANKIEGNITTLIDWRSAIALGGILGGLWGFLSLLKRR